MKRIIFLIGAGILMSAMIACEFAGITVDLGGGSADTGAGGAGAAIEAGIDSPANGATLQMQPVQISYHASSTGGVSAVELSVNGEVVSSVASPDSDQQVVALKYTWAPSSPGSHTLRVRAQGSGGNWSDYSAITVTVEGQEQAPPAEQPEPEEEPEEEEEEEEEEEGPPDTDEIAIYDVKRDADIFYYGGGGCDNDITISAKVANSEEVKALVLFVRFVDKESDGITKWDDGHSMVRKSGENYSITLVANKIPNYNMYEFAKMEYQIVVQDKAGNFNPRTKVFRDLDYQICQ